jgi:hypothetical protein
MRVRLYPEQRVMAEAMAEMGRRREPVRVVKLKCRQSGDSTLAALWTFHAMYWRPARRALVVAHHDTTTTSLYQMYQVLFNELPEELRWGQRKFNRKELSFEPPSGSSLVAQTAGYLDIGHGLTIQHCHLSETDRWPDPEVALEGILETVPQAADTSIIIESVAQSAEGWLQQFWQASKQGRTGFRPLFTPAYAVPEFRLAVPKGFQATAEERAWQQEYGAAACSPAFLMWYRSKRQLFLAKEPWGGERRLKAMYPLNDREAFQSSGFCVFPDSVLQRLGAQVQAPAVSCALYAVGMGQFRPEACAADWDGAVHIWKEPEAGRMYAVGVDIADGVGATESVVSICAWPEYEQVCEWASAHSSVEHTAWVARWLAQKYGGGNCMIIPEINKSGVLVLYILQSLPGEYGIFRWRYLDRPGQAVSDQPKLGWETNESTKKILVQVANMVFMSGGGTIKSAQLWEQMTRCVDVLPSRRWRVQGKGSDRVLAWLIAMTGAYLEFEGGQVGGVSGLGERARWEEGDGDLRRERGSWDPGALKIFTDRGLDAVGAPRKLGNYDDLDFSDAWEREV